MFWKWRVVSQWLLITSDWSPRSSPYPFNHLIEAFNGQKDMATYTVCASIPDSRFRFVIIISIFPFLFTNRVPRNELRILFQKFNKTSSPESMHIQYNYGHWFQIWVQIPPTSGPQVSFLAHNFQVNRSQIYLFFSSWQVPNWRP